MPTLTLKYNARNEIVNDLLSTIIKMTGVEVVSDNYFTKTDFKRVEKSKRSGICQDITKLEDLLKSKK